LSRGLSREAVEALGSTLAARVELHETIGSTQERARELARSGVPHGTLVVAKVQTGGRGRRGRVWLSPEGGIWMSLVLRPGLPPSLAARITPAAAVAVAKALWELGVEARIKWPNDLLVGDPPECKVCGILAEVGTDPGGADFVVLGIGLNADFDPRELTIRDRDVATIRSELGHDVDLGVLLRALLEHLERELARIEEFGSILDDWRRFDCTLGFQVRVRRSGELLEGRAVDLSPEGALLLRTSSGMEELFEGEVEHLRGA
jgi:BirA family biotin operon repressor/biotin-[acetyl-CoA-carboxylase] ligase